jgi:hypothetical protein
MKEVITIKPASVGFRKAQILVQPVPDIIAIQQEGVPVHPHQALFHQIGDGGFARTR